jgi:hypothetical protein
MMKRLLGLVVLFVVLYMYVPASYGAPASYYFLIYNVSTTVKGADADTDAKVTIPLKGYLVLKFADGCDTLVDANLILYGNDSNTPKKQKKYVQLNHSDDADLLGAYVWHVGDLIFVDFWGRDIFDFEITMQGKESLKDIGFGTTKQTVASSIKGVTIVWYDFLLGPSPDQDVSGTANASATLWTTGTKYVNQNGWTQDEIINGKGLDDGLLQILENKKYSAATLP